MPTEWPLWRSRSDQALPITVTCSSRTDCQAASGWTSLHDLLVGGDIDLVAQKPTSLAPIVAEDAADLALVDAEHRAKLFLAALTSRPLGAISSKFRPSPSSTARQPVNSYHRFTPIST